MKQFPKLVWALGATLFCAGTLTVLAEDNADQAAARAVLLQELQKAPTPQTNDTSAPPAGTAPATPPPAQAAPAETAPSASCGDNPAQAAARALLLQELATTPAACHSAAVATAGGATPAASAVAPTPDIQAIRQVQAEVEAKAAADAKAAREAKAAAMAEAARNETSYTSTVVAAPKSFTAFGGYQSPSVPAPPISADQAARLQALDAKYTANQISPVDYFNQREAILHGH
jgi:hypothetical protein